MFNINTQTQSPKKTEAAISFAEVAIQTLTDAEIDAVSGAEPTWCTRVPPRDRIDPSQPYETDMLY